MLTALETYRTAMRKFGKGTGVNAGRYRRDAQAAMVDAQAAVPCWIMSHARVSESLPATLGAFNALTKAHYSNFARRASSVAIPSVQHFWRLVGQHATLAQTLIRTAQMIRVGIEGPFRDVTPTMLFVDPGHTEEISRLALRQSTLVIAPFALPLGEPVDGVIAEFADARPEPFHLHDLITFGDRQGSTIGCLYGEYVK